MHERFCACLARKHRDALSGFHVDHVKCGFPAFDVRLTVFTTAQAPATALATEPSSLTSACTASRPDTSPENKDGTASGCRQATRATRPASHRRRTMRRPRNPVPPSAVTQEGTTRRYGAGFGLAIHILPRTKAGIAPGFRRR